MRLGVLCAVALAASPAWADDAAKAKALFDEGRKHVDASDRASDSLSKEREIDIACDKFVASLDLDPQLGTRLNLADCRIRQRKLPEAYAILEDAVAQATKSHDREAFAKQQLSALSKLVVKVKLRPPRDDIPNLSIRIDGKKIPEKEWDDPQIANPGKIVVEASAPDRKPVRITKEGSAGSEVSIIVPTLDKAEAEHDRDNERDRDRDRDKDKDRDKDTGPVEVDHTLSYVILGGGGGLLVTSGILAYNAKTRYDAAVKAGKPVDSAQHEADAATAVFVGGAVMTAVGIWMYMHDGPSVSATVSNDKVTIAWTGRF